MLGAIKNIINMINVESGNLAGVNVTGYKKKNASLGTSGDGVNSIGNDIYVKTDTSQGQLLADGNKTSLAIQGKGMFVLFDGNAKTSFDPSKNLAVLNAENTFSPPITNGSFTVNGSAVSVNTATDSFNDILNRISTATGGQVTGAYDPVQNAVTLTNTTGLPGGTITFGGAPSTNFLDVSRIADSALQKGAGNNNYLTSSGPVGVISEDQKLYYTRDGNFNFNSDGFLVNSQGLYVAGIDDQTGQLSKIDKKTFDGAGSPGDEFHFTANGVLFNDTQLSKQGKQLALAFIPNENSLINSAKGTGLYEATSNTGEINIDNPDSSGLGLLAEQSLEASNASTTDSLVNLGLLQKFFPSTVSALKTMLSTQEDLNNTIK